MRRRLAGGIAEVPSEVLKLEMLTGAGSMVHDNPDTREQLAHPSDSEALELWLCISIPVVLLLALSVAIVFYCQRRKRRRVDGADVDGGATASILPIIRMARRRRRRTPSSRLATLTVEDEQALAPWRIDPESIAPIRPLGAGKYGTVWLATYLDELVVVKKLSPPLPPSAPRTKSWRKTSSRQSGDSPDATGEPATGAATSGESALRRFVAEIRFLAAMSHPKIVTFYGVAWTSSTSSKVDATTDASGNASNLQMVLEYMRGGDLGHFLARTRTDARIRAWGARKLSMALDIVDALAYLHARQPEPVLHRDLHSKNILLDATYAAKIADFGVSRYHSLEDNDKEPKDHSIHTNRWHAPEVLAGEARYSPAVDMYAFGVILTELDSHELPFSDIALSNGQPLSEHAVLDLLRTGAIRPSLSDRCPHGVARLTMECLALEPGLRPTAAQAADRLRALVERERRVSDIGDDVSASDQNSFLGAKEDLGSLHSNSIDSSFERGFHYAVLGER
ncbi:hypothetical protein PsorP6_009805 [Peronosclerospora sorghi]|uniref:Uncharacterized protein n=1 Tax=Peronosclerospora sorghi TaxID=230839 RepID=A0ACC0VXI7_9STRA|nr:hypothetical protein PsorP6_009805 [Peronosclerospora sorghi]